MAISAVPFSLQNGSHSAALFRQAVSSIVPDNGGLGEFGDLAVTQTGTPSMAVTVGVGRAWVPGTNVTPPTGFTYTSQAQYFAFNDAPVTLTVNPADPTNPRIDLVCLTINDSAYTGSTNNAVLQVITGAPAASPAAPATPANSLVLAQVSVAANATSITNSNITFKAYPVWSRYIELTGSTSPTANALWGPGPLSIDTANSVNYSSWAYSPSNDRVNLTPGQYVVFIRYTLNPGATGTTWGAIVNDANTFTYAGADYVGGANNVCASTPILIQSQQNVRFTFITGTAGATLTSRIRIVKTM